MYQAKAYSASSATSPLASTTVARRDPNEHDIEIEILFCGICHSDLHQVRNEWSGVMPTVYPCVPGHEIAGRVTRVGAAVTGFKAGDLAAVGCGVLMAVTRRAWWWMNALSCMFLRASTLPEPRPCSARASQPTHPCGTGESQKARKLAWRASADWDTWA